jgi:tetratricopeptide (TPR) repeat protein
MRRIASALDDALHLIEVCPHEWRFDFPRIDDLAHRTHSRAIEHLHWERYSEAVAALEPLVRVYPEFIDAHDTLAHAYACEGKRDKAYSTWDAATKLGLDLFPADFYLGRDRLIWGYTDNRPFLGAYFNLGLEHFRRGLIGEAVCVFQNILYLNPTDNQAARLFVVRCFLRLRRPHDVLSFCKLYDDDANPDLLYGQVLAFYQLGRKKEAAAALAEAVEYRPLVAAELTRKTRLRPNDSHPRSITMGGADEAIEYWRAAGEFWTQTRGAIAFVRRALREKEASYD